VILTTCSRDCACQLSNAHKDREVAEPDENESVDEASRSATVMISHAITQICVGSTLLLEANGEDPDQR